MPTCGGLVQVENIRQFMSEGNHDSITHRTKQQRVVFKTRVTCYCILVIYAYKYDI